MLDSLLVGFGSAGQRLHLPSLLHARRLCCDEGLFSDQPIVAIDTSKAREPHAHARSPVQLFRTLNEGLSGRDPLRMVAHVCTPPRGRTETLRAIWAAGIRHTICEKPVATSRDELRQIVSLAQREGATVLVASPWLASTITGRIRQVLASGELGELETIDITQEKARFTRTQRDAGHPTAFEVELPHSVGLAIHLAGPVARVDTSTAHDMTVESIVYPGLGGAVVQLAHAGGIRSTLRSDLASPVRRRRIIVRCARGEIEGHFPVGGDDQFGQIIVRRDRCALIQEVLRDDNFTRMLIKYYTHFAGTGDPIVSDLRFHTAVVETLSSARTMAGLPSSTVTGSDQRAA